MKFETINQCMDRIITYRSKRPTNPRKLTALVCAKMFYGGNSPVRFVNWKEIHNSEKYIKLIKSTVKP